MKYDPDDYNAPEILAEWMGEQRQNVIEYLAGEGVSFDGIEDRIPDEPEFFVAPYLAVWPVMNSRNSECVGYWVISGDLPTDYVSSDDAGDVREVLLHFSRSWAEVAEYMKAGEKHPTITMGPSEMWPTLAPLLAARAEILKEFAENDELWEDKADDDETEGESG